MNDNKTFFVSIDRQPGVISSHKDRFLARVTTEGAIHIFTVDVPKSIEEKDRRASAIKMFRDQIDLIANEVDQLK